MEDRQDVQFLLWSLYSASTSPTIDSIFASLNLNHAVTSPTKPISIISHIYGPQTVEERRGRSKTNLLSNPCNLRSNFTCSCVFSTFFVPLSASVDEAISARICGGTYFPFSVADGGVAVVVGVSPVVAVDGDGATFSGDDEGASWVTALEVVFAFVNAFRRSFSISSSSFSDSEV